MSYSYGRKIGTSLAFCVRDIVSGRCKIDDVQLIVAGTDFKSPEEAIEKYKRTYWGRFPKKAAKVCIKLWETGRVFQPKLESPTAILYIRDLWYYSMQELIDVQIATNRLEVADILEKKFI